MAVLFLAALAILLIAPGAISAETESEGATKEPAWSADMLVVEYTAVSIGAASADLFSNIGGSRDLKIKSLWSHVPSRDIRLAFQEGVSDVDDLTLIVGELTLEFPPGSSGNSSFKWTDVDVDWEDGETIPVSIVQTSAPEEPEEKEEPAANNPATGAPTISGTAQVGETLTAETSSIADEDGLDDVSYSYQWTRSNGSTYADLAGETGSTYTLVYADQGKTVKVKVSFTDDADNDETLTSEATEVVTAAPNRAATGEPTISGTPNVDQTLTAATSAIADDDGLTKVSYSYQWLANDGNSDADIEDATDSTYTLSVGDVGKTIKVSVSFTDDRNNAEARTSVATAAVLATVPTEPLNLTVTRGSQIQELDASWQAPSSNGGSAVTGYKLQWKEAADSWDTEADVSEDTVTGTSHTITSLTGGVEYSVRVIATNIAGDGPGSTEVRATPAGSTTARRGLVVIMMSSRDHHSITKGTKTQFQVSASNLPRDNDPATVDYILRGDVTETQGGANVDSCEDANLGTDIPISVVDSVYVQYGGTFGGPGCTAGNYTVTYVVTEADTDNRMAGIVFYYEVTEGLSEGSLGSSNNPATGAPTISGTSQVDQTLTASTWTRSTAIADQDGLHDVSYNYQWIADDTDIQDATDSTYTPSVTDVGNTIKVKVSFTDDRNNAEARTSLATTAVLATVPTQPLSLTVATGDEIQELDASWQAPSSNGGSSITGYKVQWKESAGSWDTAADVSQATVTGTTHTITSLTGGVEYAVRVIATNVAGDGPASTEARATPADSPASGEEGTETVESDSTAAWTTTLTVGVSGSGSEAVWGYSWFLDGMGTLDERTYSEGDQTIEVMAILLSNGFVAFNVRPHPSVDFVLTVDGTEFASADASEVKSQTLISYVWATTLDWAEDDRVASSLTLKDTESAEQSEPQGLQVVSVSHDEDRRSYITVVVEDDYSDPENTKTRFQVTWYDTEECTVHYNTYLQYRTEEGTEVKAHLGASPPGQSQSASTLPRPNGGEYALGVYCGTNNGDSGENLVASVQIQDESLTLPGYTSINLNDSGPATVGKPRPGTYTTAPPMTSLVASPGSLTPSFHRSQLAYTLAEVPDNINQITLHIMARSGAHFEFVRAPAGTPERHSCSQVVGYIWKCQYSYGEDAVVLSDADPSMPGFQIDLEEGENQLGIHIRGGSEWNVRKSWTEMYRLTVTRSDATGDSLGEQDTDPDEVSATDDSTAPVANAESSPLTSLLVDEFSLTPAFSRTDYSYTVADVDGSVEQITFHAMGVDGSHIVFVKNATGVVRVCSPASYGYYDECNYGYFSTEANPYTVSSDADPSAPGFQVELDEGDTRLGIHLHGGTEWRTVGRLYELLIDRANTPATGLPTITGTPQVEQTLTAEASAIEDADGLTNVSYRYQWTAGGSDIDGATGSSYALTSSEQGETIQVRVTFTDDAGNDETLTSASVGPVQAGESAPGAPIRLTSRWSVPGDDKGIRLEWRAPPGTVTGYRILRTEAPVTASFASGDPLPHGCTIETVVHVDDTGSDATTYIDTDVAEAAYYVYLVKAINSDGVGPQSQATSLQYRPHRWWPSGVPGTPPPTVNLLSTRVNDGVELTWDAPPVPRPEATGYQILRRQPEQCEFGYRVYVDDTGNTETRWIDTDAEPGTLYEYHVRAINDVGAGGFSSSSTSIRPATLEAGDQPNSPASGAPTIAGTVQVGETLTADTSGIDDDDGLTGARFFFQWLSGEDTEIAGATSATYNPVSADQGKTIQVRVTFTDDAGNAESLTSTATTPIAARPAETPAVLLTASFANVPADHNGGNFTFQLTFSENVEAGYARIRDHAFTVTGATIDSASRITQGSNQGWNVEVNPTGNEAITVTLPETTDCNATGAICTDDSRKLSHPTSAIVAGPPAISVSDANVQEAEGAVLVFTVTLSHTSSRTVTVDYATSDGTAQAESDYTAASGKLTFNAGDTSQTVQVTVLTDQEDESDETLTLTLSNPSQATLDDATGTGAIENGESSSETQEDPPAETPAVLLTASFSNVPASHIGSGEFTFDLSFSENVKAGYERVRDDAFTIVGGDILKAQRREQGTNQYWTITVKPDGNGAVYITLPETTDCNATGAICTDDERKLSNSTPASIAGPQ